jgi:Reverse transcriptase (RNA-dependent DNA polymerase)
VVVTDIADFYPRIYLHRLENALLTAAKSMPDHAKGMVRLLKGWNQNVSYGLPVGSNPSRLLAELVIDDVDRTLLSEGILFARYVDDYRIFCNSRHEAYQCLARLANVLYETQGLTLQSQKTRIMTVEEFNKEILKTEERKEFEALATGFRSILSKLNVDDPYDLVEFSNLPSNIQEQINGLNLEGLLDKQLIAAEIDIPMTRFLINRLGWLKRTSALSKLLNDTDKLYPVFSEVIRYLAQIIDNLSQDSREKVGALLLGQLGGSVVSHLEFHRMMIVGLFAGSSKWGNSEKLAGYYNLASDNWFRRTLVLALGKAHQDFWLRSKKIEMEQMPLWERRAFVYAASCFPSDEKKFWYNAIKPKLDILEKHIITWALNNPIA